MLNFTYYNPTRIVFGKGTIAELEKLVPQENKVLMLYGGGSIKCNGVYDQVRAGAGPPRRGRTGRHRAQSTLRNLPEGAWRRCGPKKSISSWPSAAARSSTPPNSSPPPPTTPARSPGTLIRNWPLLRGSRYAAGHGADPARHRLGNERRGGHLPPSDAGETLLRLRAHLSAVLHPRSGDDLFAPAAAVRQRHHRRLRAGPRTVLDLRRRRRRCRTALPRASC